MIEENLSPEERWQRNEKDRLEYENYCNKIIQGLEENWTRIVVSVLYGNLFRMLVTKDLMKMQMF